MVAFAAFAIVFTFASCGDPTVYTAGRYYNGSTTVACYWKNKAKTDLFPGLSVNADSFRSKSIC